MSKKKKAIGSGIVYSTDPGFIYKNDTQDISSPPASEQKLTVRLDKKNRGGKMVTIIEGYFGNERDMEELAKKLKSFCGTGGSYKDGEIIVQGDNRDKIVIWLMKNGYNQVRKL